MPYCRIWRKWLSICKQVWGWVRCRYFIFCFWWFVMSCCKDVSRNQIRTSYGLNWNSGTRHFWKSILPQLNIGISQSHFQHTIPPTATHINFSSLSFKNKYKINFRTPSILLHEHLFFRATFESWELELVGKCLLLVVCKSQIMTENHRQARRSLQEQILNC